MAPEIIAAYDAPFPDADYRAGPRMLPSLVPTGPDDSAAADNRRAWEALARFERPFLTAFTDQDPLTRGGDRRMRSLIPGATNQPHRTIEGAGHFVQEDAPAALVEAILEVVDRSG